MPTVATVSRWSSSTGHLRHGPDDAGHGTGRSQILHREHRRRGLYRRQIELTGSFAALDEVLHEINHDTLLLRIDSFALASDPRAPGQTSLQLSVMMLKEQK